MLTEEDWKDWSEQAGTREMLRLMREMRRDLLDSSVDVDEDRVKLEFLHRVKGMDNLIDLMANVHKKEEES